MQFSLHCNAHSGWKINVALTVILFHGFLVTNKFLHRHVRGGRRIQRIPEDIMTATLIFKLELRHLSMERHSQDKHQKVFKKEAKINQCASIENIWTPFLCNIFWRLALYKDKYNNNRAGVPLLLQRGHSTRSFENQCSPEHLDFVDRRLACITLHKLGYKRQPFRLDLQAWDPHGDLPDRSERCKVRIVWSKTEQGSISKVSILLQPEVQPKEPCLWPARKTTVRFLHPHC